ncbi:hypothetical protein [Haloarcula mannanilytica]|uniref:hypothetical protein n=1 Tax=Haloarcula mannanilytica TaxID=2509225 RepID=UPI00190F7459|nr:hypothetical protein [Haloarcula mannanilytica]
MSVRFHVVCHECAFEGIYGDQSVAESQRDAHAVSSGHRMSLRDISDRNAPGPTQ